MILPDVRKAEVGGKKVFLRLDLDVPLSEVRGEKLEVRISDDMRLEAGLPTIELLLKNGAKIIMAGHLGRPSGRDNTFTLEPIASWYAAKFQISNFKFQIQEFEGWKFNENLYLLENLRFYPGEEKNDDKFSQKLASLADLYVNDAFAASHRNHASIVGVSKFLPHYAGLRLQKEVEVLSDVLENPRRPLVIIIGGAKIETKLPLIEKMHGFADYVLVGGELAKETKELLKVEHEKVPRKSQLVVADLNSEGTDITSESFTQFFKIIKTAQTIVWNGPMGRLVQSSKFKVQSGDTEKGTRDLANAIVESSAHTVVGGGDTVGFLKRKGLIDKFSFVSTGGGAMLEFLSGEKLPGIEALTTK